MQISSLVMYFSVLKYLGKHPIICSLQQSSVGGGASSNFILLLKKQTQMIAQFIL